MHGNLLPLRVRIVFGMLAALSLVNEAETLPECIAKVQRVLCQHGIAGEIIVADNGSTDGSCDIAARMGVRVVRVKDKGYGNALRGGAASARGRFAAYDKNQNGALITAVRGALMKKLSPFHADSATTSKSSPTASSVLRT